jgi:serine/threonine-protein kinase
MQSSTWDRLEAVFFEALALPAEQRADYLERACFGDLYLRAEVEALLAAHPANGEGDDAQPAPGRRVGTSVGAYRLDALIGDGLGEVYRAHRAGEQYEHEVAVKIVRSGLPVFEMVRRFRQERQILARLEHPNVATLLDGGVTAEGQPYLVMQYVCGSTITEYVDTRALAISERLRLFVTVCRAVQFAHANLVVHRDLRPSNILVTDDGQVRLVDFGIAKLLDPDDTSGTIPTESLLLLMTPEHAAPEQFLGQPITTATDVYQLGVLLYQLLSGARPFQAGTAVGLDRAICELEPTRPSAAIGRSAELGTEAGDRVGEAHAALARSTTPDALRRQLRGDLDCIVLKALNKDPTRRYGSAADLADDIERHLGGFPVRARPESRGYIMGRFVRRHRAGVFASGALAASLVALAATTSKHSLAIAAERDVAVQVSDFLENMFAVRDPFAAGGSRRDTLRVRMFLEEGSRKMQNDLKSQPQVQAQLFSVLGNLWRSLGRSDEATPLLRQAVTLRERTSGAHSPEVGASRADLAQLLEQQGKYKEAEAMARSGIAILERDSIQHAHRLSVTWSVLGNVFKIAGRYPDAETAYRRALALSAYDTASDSKRAEKLANLGVALGRQAKLDEAAQLLREAVDLSRRQNGNDHPKTATMLNDLAVVLEEAQKLDSAEVFLREALAIRRAHFKSPHPAIAISINNLADLVLSRNDPKGAEPLFRESLAMRRALYGRQHPTVGVALADLATALSRQGRRAEALRYYSQAQAVVLRALGPNHPTLASVIGNVGGLFHAAGDHAGALGHFRRALEIQQRNFDASHPYVLTSLSDVGRCLIYLQRYKEAEAVLMKAYAGLEAQRGKQERLFNAVQDRLGVAYRGMGRNDEAAKYETMRKASR